MYEVLSLDGGPTSAPRLFTHHDSHPIVLHHILTRDMGIEWLVWDYSTLWDEINKTYNIIVSNLNRCKIQALRTLQANELFWENWDIATPVFKALNNRLPDFYIFQPPTPVQLLAGVDMINDIRRHKFSPEVRTFIASILLNDGLIYAPAPLDFVQEELDRKHYRCNNCGQIAMDYKHKECDSCGSGNLVRFQKTDEGELEEIKSFVDLVLAGADVAIYEDRKGVHAAKWKVAQDYVDVLHQRLNEQMRLV